LQMGTVDKALLLRKAALFLFSLTPANKELTHWRSRDLQYITAAYWRLGKWRLIRMCCLEVPLPSNFLSLVPSATYVKRIRNMGLVNFPTLGSKNIFPPRAHLLTHPHPPIFISEPHQKSSMQWRARSNFHLRSHYPYLLMFRSASKSSTAI